MCKLDQIDQMGKECAHKNHFFTFQVPYSENRHVTHFYFNVTLEGAFKAFLKEKNWTLDKYKRNKRKVFVCIGKFSDHLKIVDDFPLMDENVIAKFSASFDELQGLCYTHEIPVQ